MRAKDGVGIELLQIALESCARIAWKQPLYSVKAPSQLWIISLFEHHAPEFRRAFNQLDVTVGNDFSVQRRKEFHQINTLDSVPRMIGSPRFLQSRGRSDMSSAGSHRCNQYS